MRQRVCGCSGTLVVLYDPISNAHFFRGHCPNQFICFRLGTNLKFQRFAFYGQRIQNRPIQKRSYLFRCKRNNFLFIAPLLHFLTAVHQKLHIVSFLSRLTRLFFTRVANELEITLAASIIKKVTG